MALILKQTPFCELCENVGSNRQINGSIVFAIVEEQVNVSVLVIVDYDSDVLVALFVFRYPVRFKSLKSMDLEILMLVCIVFCNQR